MRRKKPTARNTSECESAVEVVLPWLGRNANLRLKFQLAEETALVKSRARGLYGGARWKVIVSRQIRTCRLEFLSVFIDVVSNEYNTMEMFRHEQTPEP